jgi:hypothetical protein
LAACDLRVAARHFSTLLGRAPTVLALWPVSGQRVQEVERLWVRAMLRPPPKRLLEAGKGGCAAGGDGREVGNSGGGGIGRVAPRKSLGDKPAAIISRSNSLPTMMCPGEALSSGEDHCPLEEASSVEIRQKPEEFPSGWVAHHRDIRGSRRSQTERPRPAPNGQRNPERAGTRSERRVPRLGSIKSEPYPEALRRAQDRGEGPNLDAESR